MHSCNLLISIIMLHEFQMSATESKRGKYVSSYQQRSMYNWMEFGSPYNVCLHFCLVIQFLLTFFCLPVCFHIPRGQTDPSGSSCHSCRSDWLPCKHRIPVLGHPLLPSYGNLKKRKHLALKIKIVNILAKEKCLSVRRGGGEPSKCQQF